MLEHRIYFAHPFDDLRDSPSFVEASGSGRIPHPTSLDASIAVPTHVIWRAGTARPGTARAYRGAPDANAVATAGARVRAIHTTIVAMVVGVVLA